MFTKSKDEITYEVIKTFCQSEPEGVRVEYKREIKDIEGKIPKVISSFANTYGGICVIGVDANQVDNRGTTVPGIPREKGIEERIQGSAWDGIHQPVTPQVILVDVPKTDNIVVVIRVEESMHAPHAIEQGTKVYFRTGSVSKPHKLSDIDRIEYMLKRREGAEQTFQRVLAQCKEIGKDNDANNILRPQIGASIHPIFTYRPLMAPAEIYDIFFDNTIRRVQGGVAWARYNNKTDYTVINEYGIVYNLDYIYLNKEEELSYQDTCAKIIPSLKQAVRLYKACEYFGSVQIDVEIKNVYNVSLVFPESIFVRHPAEVPRCLKNNIHIQIQCFATDLTNEDSCISVFMELSRQLFWTFDLPDKVNESQKFLSLLKQWYSQL